MLRGMVIRCGLLALLSALWLASYLLPITVDGGSPPEGGWVAFSRDGLLGWAEVTVEGPSLGEADGADARAELYERVERWGEEVSLLRWSVGSNMRGWTSEPGAELDRVHERHALLGWSLLVVLALASILWSLWCRWRGRASSGGSDAGPFGVA